MFGAMSSPQPSPTPRAFSQATLATGLGLIAIVLAAATVWAPVSSADSTIGAYVNQNPSTSGTCGYKAASERPCLFVDTIIPALATTAPCDGTVTRFRLNGLPKPNNHYRLRVVRQNADYTFTGTAGSDPVTLTTDGVNEFVTSLPIKAGEYIGVDFEESTEQFGLRWVEQPGTGAYFFNAFPADGGSVLRTGSSTISYLYNADVACTPSNAFKVIKLKGTALSLELTSQGQVTVTAVTGKGKPKLLKPSKVSGGPGRVKDYLRLTPSAKKVLAEKGKVRIRAGISFTPTGGNAKVLTRTLTVKKPKAAK